MKSDHVKFRRAPETKFLMVDQEVFDRLSPYAIKVYGQLRKLTSYTKENDETEITVKNLATAAGISERKTYQCLNELEYEHYIIQRHNVFHIRYGQINTFDVSQTYGYYKPTQSESTPAPQAAPVDNYGQNLSPTAPRAVPPAQYAVPTAPNADLYKEQDLSQEVSKKKQNKEPVKPPVSVFSCTESVKNHLTLVINKRKAYVEDEIIEQGIYYAYETNQDKSFDSVNKRLNIFLKKVREGKWLIPQGFNGITSQSIRQAEEEIETKKKAQYQKEAQVFRAITQTVNQGYGMRSLKDVLNHLKGISGGKETDNGAMQA